MKSEHQPIGYWVKQVDTLLTNGIDEIQQAYGLTRTGWQLIHTISKAGSMQIEELHKMMQPFANAEQLKNLFQQLIDENRIYLPSENKYSLTKNGNQLHAQCMEEQNNFRQKVMLNITSQEYETTLETLRKIVTNLS